MITDENVEVLLDDLLRVHGYDFADYSKASLKRRITRLYSLDKFVSFAEFRYHLNKDDQYLKRFVEEITVNVTEMFRDPGFYQALRTNVLPLLATYPLIRIWHAGCATGEEVFSFAILLKEAGLLNRAILYATDLNTEVLAKARKGIFPLSQMKQYSENYIASGGQHDFSSYYTAKYSHAVFETELKEKMVFAAHNLVSDHSFNEFQLIFCRNVLIYFEKNLQEKVLTLFDNSLEPLGFLALGSKETIKFSKLKEQYTQIGKEKIWRKMK
jgi:chemotaxis protein methyltransferase CheR